MERAPELFTTPASQSAEQARIMELERLVGQLALLDYLTSAEFEAFQVAKDGA